MTVWLKVKNSTIWVIYPWQFYKLIKFLNLSFNVINKKSNKILKFIKEIRITTTTRYITRN